MSPTESRTPTGFEAHKSIRSYVTAQNVAFIVALCTLSAFAWLSLQTATRLVEDRAAVENAHAILDHLGMLSSRVERAEGTRRGFAAVGDIRYLARTKIRGGKSRRLFPRYKRWFTIPPKKASWRR